MPPWYCKYEKIVAGGFDKTLEILAIGSPAFHKCPIVSFIL
jgi:hypothetical protein